MATVLRSLRLNRCDLVDEPANPKAHVVLYKRAEGAPGTGAPDVTPSQPDVVAKEQPGIGAVHVDRPDWLAAEKAVMDAGTRGNLPDSAFAAVWTDADGKKQRKLPYRHADGSIDLSHLRNALSRISQTDMPSSVRGKAQRKLDAAKEQHMKKSFLAKLKDLFKEAEAEAGPLADWAAQEEAEPEHTLAQKLAAHCAKLGEAIGAYGDGEFPPEHPVHSLKALFKEMGDTVAACNKSEEPDGDEGKPPAPPMGDITKSVEVSKRETELAKKLADSEAELAKRDAELAKAREDAAIAATTTELRKFAHVSVNPEADAPIFKSLSETNKAAYDRVMEILSGAEGVVSKSNLTKEIGSPLPGDGKADTAWAAIEAEADAMTKADPKVTKAKAIDVVMKKRPDLVTQHLAAANAAQAQ
jgi:hypothetical protein